MSDIKRRKIVKYIAIAVCVAAVGFLAVEIFVIFSGKGAGNTPVEVGENTEEEYVTLAGKKYKHKSNLSTYLVVGVDAVGEVSKVEEYDGTGQCDVLIVIVVDRQKNTYATLSINRNTIADVQSLDLEDYSVLATVPIQIAFAHTEGDGMEISSENTVAAVESLLKGETIDKYASFHIDAIEKLNGLVGGVTVTIEDDFSKEDPSLVMGETITLTDEQAHHFVRGRMNVGDGTNENRMARQEVFLEALKPKLFEKIKSDQSFVKKAQKVLEPYTVTNLTGKDLSRLAKAVTKNQFIGNYTFEGETREDELGFLEFHPNPESVERVLAELFYEEVE